ncbi:MAG: TadG family pilus assembly protein [Acidimicrobiia bacterium]
MRHRLRAACTTRRTADGRREHGFLLVWFAMLVVVLVAMGGFAVDYGFWYLHARDAQKAADAASLAAVVARAGSNDPSYLAAAQKAAWQAAHANGIDTPSYVKAHFDDENGVALPLNQVRVTVEDNAPVFFSRIVGIGSPHITKTATAEYEPAPPMGSPSNVLGNDGGEPGYNQLDPANRLGQSLWLDVHGHRTPVANGDQYQSGNCSTYQDPGPNIAGGVDPCAGTTDNQSFVNGFLGGKPGAEGYYYKIDIKNPVAGAPVDVQVFDPALGAVRSDCRDATLTAPFAEGADVAPQWFLSYMPVDTSGMQAGLGTLGIILVANWQGSPAAVAQHVLSLGWFNPGGAPTVPDFWTAPAHAFALYNTWQMLQNYGVTKADLTDIVSRYAPGPQNPSCTGDDIWSPNFCLNAVLCNLMAVIYCLINPSACIGGIIGSIIGGGAAREPGRIEPIQPPRDGGTTIQPIPRGVPPASGKSPGRTVANFSGYDGIAETRFTLLAPTPGVGTTDYRHWQTVCQDTYGWWLFQPPLLSPIEPQSVWWYNFLFNGDAVWPNPFGLSGALPLGKDFGSNNFSTSGIQNFGHRFRDTFRKWVKLNNGGCQPTIQSSWIQGGKAELVLQVQTNTRDNTFNDPAGGQSNTCDPTCGYGANRFALRAKSGASPVEIFADQKMALMGNFTSGSGKVWFTEIDESPGRSRSLDVALYDPGDVWVCRDDYINDPNTPRFADPGHPDTSPVNWAPGHDLVPDGNLTIDCDRAGGSGIGAGYKAKITPLDPFGNKFSTCKVWNYTSAGEPPDSISNIKTPCELSDVDSRYNGKTLMLKIPIPADYTCNAALPTTPVDLRCWTKLQFDYPTLPAGLVARPEDVTTWTAVFEGTPVHLVK